MNKLSLAALVLVLGGCAPAEIQHSFRMQQADGQLIYHIDGYTSFGETTAGDGRQHLAAAMNNECPNGFTIIREAEKQTNGGHFLQWDGEAKCNPSQN